MPVAAATGQEGGRADRPSETGEVPEIAGHQPGVGGGRNLDEWTVWLVGEAQRHHGGRTVVPPP